MTTKKYILSVSRSRLNSFLAYCQYLLISNGQQKNRVCLKSENNIRESTITNYLFVWSPHECKIPSSIGCQNIKKHTNLT